MPSAQAHTTGQLILSSWLLLTVDKIDAANAAVGMHLYPQRIFVVGTYITCSDTAVQFNKQ